MTNSELEVALDLELDKSSLLCNKLRGAFEGLSRTLSLKSEFEQDQEDEAAERTEPFLFSVFLQQQHGVGESGPVGAESNRSTADSQAALLLRSAASPHPFDKTRHGHVLHGSTTPPREMGPAVASATGTLSMSKLLERLKRTQGLATPGAGAPDVPIETQR